MNHKLTKSIQWSYPTSPNSERFGFEKTGCFTLELTDPAGLIPPQPLKGFATEIEAMKAAKTLPQAWDRLYVKYHPESFVGELTVFGHKFNVHTKYIPPQTTQSCKYCGEPVNLQDSGVMFENVEVMHKTCKAASCLPSTSQGDEEERARDLDRLEKQAFAAGDNATLRAIRASLQKGGMQ